VVYGDGRGPRVDAPAVRIPHVEQHADGLLHLRLPVESSDGSVIGALGVIQESVSFSEVIMRIRRNEWLTIITCLASLSTVGEPVNITLVNDGAVFHDVAIDELGSTLSAEPGKRATGSLMIDEQGTYRSLSTVRDHAAAGMRGTLQVSPGR
jgi:hypothetical protein